MNTNDLIIMLISAMFASVTIMIIARNFLRNQDNVAKTRSLKRLENSAEIQTRRKSTSYPGIVCAFPILQVARAEAPFTDIWSR